MHLLELIKKETNLDLKPLLFFSVLSGASNAALLAIINGATTNGDNRSDDVRLLFMCILCIGIFILTKRYVLRKGMYVVEELVRKIRVRLVNKIRHSELLMMDEIGTSDVYARITKDAVQVSHSAETVSNGFQSFVMVLFTVIYVAFLSVPAFLIMVLYFALGIYTYLRLSGLANRLLVRATKMEGAFFDALDSILYGFKEIKINKKKNQSLFNRFNKVTEDTRELYVSANYRFITSYLFAQSFFYILLSVIIFILPMHVTISAAHIIKISSAVLFIVGPMETLVASIPVLMASNVAAKNIIDMERKLETNLAPNELEQLNNPDLIVEPLEFNKEILLKNITFQYPRNGFTVGPVTMHIRKGEITFISGGNGAGKSTILKLFSGLYYPASGYICVDDTVVDTSNYPNYRELLSVIFTDFFLFERLYGLEHVDHRRVNELMSTMMIDQKTKIVDHTITERNLSTGQRKRLALVVSLLEDKSVYVFDEVAADQDPSFKKYFYRELLAEMKSQGKTVIVVTHDDFYFDVCDHHYKLENGKLYNNSSVEYKTA